MLVVTRKLVVKWCFAPIEWTSCLLRALTLPNIFIRTILSSWPLAAAFSMLDDLSSWIALLLINLVRISKTVLPLMWSILKHIVTWRWSLRRELSPRIRSYLIKSWIVHLLPLFHQLQDIRIRSCCHTTRRLPIRVWIRQELVRKLVLTILSRTLTSPTCLGRSQASRCSSLVWWRYWSSLWPRLDLFDFLKLVTAISLFAIHLVESVLYLFILFLAHIGVLLLACS